MNTYAPTTNPKWAPDSALTCEPTAIPTYTKVMYDWPAFIEMINAKGFAVVRVPVTALTTTQNGSTEAPMLKALLTYVHGQKLPRLSVRRLSETRWLVRPSAKPKTVYKRKPK